MEGYCVKCRSRREIQNPQSHHHEEREARDPGYVPCLPDGDVQDREGLVTFQNGGF